MRNVVVRTNIPDVNNNDTNNAGTKSAASLIRGPFFGNGAVGDNAL